MVRIKAVNLGLNKRKEKLGDSKKPKRISRKLIVLIIILAVLAAGFYFYGLFSPTYFVEEKGIALTKETLPAYLERHPVIKILPENTKIELNIGDAAYFIQGSEVNLISEKTGEMQLSPEDVDIIINLPDGFEKDIGMKGLCGSIDREELNNGVVNIKTEKTESELLSKYGVFAVRAGDCL